MLTENISLKPNRDNPPYRVVKIEKRKAVKDKSFN